MATSMHITSPRRASRGSSDLLMVVNNNKVVNNNTLPIKVSWVENGAGVSIPDHTFVDAAIANWLHLETINKFSFSHQPVHIKGDPDAKKEHDF